MWSNQVYSLPKFQTHSVIDEYFTDQNKVNFRLFFN